MIAPAAAEWLVLRTGTTHWALHTRDVQDVLPLRGLTPLPGTPAFMRGIVNVRGRVTAVLDLQLLFNLPEPGISDLHRLVLVAHAGWCFGLLAGIDLVVRPASDAVLVPVPPLVQDAGCQAVQGMTADGLLVLDIARLCIDPRIVVDDDRQE